MLSRGAGRMAEGRLSRALPGKKRSDRVIKKIPAGRHRDSSQGRTVEEKRTSTAAASHVQHELEKGQMWLLYWFSRSEVCIPAHTRSVDELAYVLTGVCVVYHILQLHEPSARLEGFQRRWGQRGPRQ